jgi:hypothetical protein
MAGLFHARRDRIRGMGPIYDNSYAPEIVVELIWCLCVSCPLWIPFVFAGYWIGRRRFGISTIITLTGVMAIATLFSVWMSRVALWRE